MAGSGGAGCWPRWRFLDDCFLNGAVFSVVFAEEMLVGSASLLCRPGARPTTCLRRCSWFCGRLAADFLGRPALSTQPAGAQGWTLADKKSDVFGLHFLNGIFVEFEGVEELVLGGRRAPRLPSGRGPTSR